MLLIPSDTLFIMYQLHKNNQNTDNFRFFKKKSNFIALLASWIVKKCIKQ